MATIGDSNFIFVSNHEISFTSGILS